MISSMECVLFLSSLMKLLARFIPLYEILYQYHHHGLILNHFDRYQVLLFYGIERTSRSMSMVFPYYLTFPMRLLTLFQV